MEAKDGEVPPAALKVLLLALSAFSLQIRWFFLSHFQIGYESNGDPLFVARGRVVKDGFDNSSMSVGKMNPRYGLAYLPYGGEVVIRHT